MKLLGQVTDVTIYYATAGHEDWTAQLPSSGWVLLAIADTAAQVPVGALCACLQRSPAGIGCAGQWASVLEDNFDMEIVLQALEREKQQQQQPFEYNYAPVTTAHSDLAEADSFINRRLAAVRLNIIMSDNILWRLSIMSFFTR